MIEQPNRTVDAIEAEWSDQRASMSLRSKLLTFAALLVVIPGVLLGAIAVRSGSGSLQRVIGRQLAREAGHTADRLASALRSERQTLDSFARQDMMREVRVADIDKRVAMALATLRAGSHTRLGYLVIDGSGRVVAASDPHWLRAFPAWLEPSRAEGEPVVGPLEAPGAQALVLRSPIPDPDDARRILGTLIGVLDWRALTAVTQTVQAELAAQGVMADVLVCRDGVRIGGAAGDEACEAAQGASGAPDYTVHRNESIVGRAVLSSPVSDWVLLVVEARAHALAPVARLSRHLLFTMGLALLAALTLATLAARRVVRPLSELTRAIRGLARNGARQRRVPVRSNDEVGTLATAFNDMAADLDRTQGELIEAEKFAFVGELAAGVAHEIRTSLGVLGSSAQILERSIPADAEAQVGELAQMIRAEVGRLGGVVDDLLTLDRSRPLRLVATQLSGPVLRAADFVAPRALERGVSIERSAPSAEPHVSCDPELIYQVAVNLLVNAIQALGEGGRIAVRILEEREGYGGFEVQDDGPGIPAQLEERIFQPFVSASGGGVGLGLTFVKRAVHDHRGRISVTSSEGAGTRVAVDLPAVEAEA